MWRGAKKECPEYNPDDATAKELVLLPKSPVREPPHTRIHAATIYKPQCRDEMLLGLTDPVVSHSWCMEQGPAG